MSPIRFTCKDQIRRSSQEIADQILDLQRWSEFNGYGPLPGIESAEFEQRAEGVVGTRIRVKNRDGSHHVEEVEEWEPTRRLRLKLHEFSRPVSRLATHFEETWEFENDEGQTRVVRT